MTAHPPPPRQPPPPRPPQCQQSRQETWETQQQRQQHHRSCSQPATAPPHTRSRQWSRTPPSTWTETDRRPPPRPRNSSPPDTPWRQTRPARRRPCLAHTLRARWIEPRRRRPADREAGGRGWGRNTQSGMASRRSSPTGSTTRRSSCGWMSGFRKTPLRDTLHQKGIRWGSRTPCCTPGGGRRGPCRTNPQDTRKQRRSLLDSTAAECRQPERSSRSCRTCPMDKPFSGWDRGNSTPPDTAIGRWTPLDRVPLTDRGAARMRWGRSGPGHRASGRLTLPYNRRQAHMP